MDQSLFPDQTLSVRVQLGLKHFIGCSFQQLQQPPKVKRAINLISDTALSDCVLYKPYDNIQIYPFNFLLFVNIYQDKFPQYGVCLPCGLINMGKFLFTFLTSLKMGLFQNP